MTKENFFKRNLLKGVAVLIFALALLVGGLMMSNQQITEVYAYAGDTVATVWFDENGNNAVDGDETVSEYANLNSAWDYAIGLNTTSSCKATITLLANVTEVTGLVNTADYLVLDLNNYNLTFKNETQNTDGYRLESSGGNIDIVGNGIMSNYAVGDRVMHATVSIIGGTGSLTDATITNTSTGSSSSLYVANDNTTFNIYSRTVKTLQSSCALLINEGTVNIKSGNFIAGEYGAIYSDGIKGGYVNYISDVDDVINVTNTFAADSLICVANYSIQTINGNGIVRAEAVSGVDCVQGLEAPEKNRGYGFLLLKNGTFIVDVSAQSLEESAVFTNYPVLCSGSKIISILSGSDEANATSKTAISEIETTAKYAFIQTEYIGEKTIIFNAEGGSVSPISQDVMYNATNISLAIPTKSGYTFAGWYSAAGGTGTQVTGSDGDLAQSTYEEETTIYAKWTVNSYAILFESNGGSAVDSITQNYNTSVSKPTDPTRTGYTFAGWYTDNSTFTSAVTWPTTMPVGWSYFLCKVDSKNLYCFLLRSGF